MIVKGEAPLESEPLEPRVTLPPVPAPVNRPSSAQDAADFHLLDRDWRPELIALLQQARSDVLITAPYITKHGVELVHEHLSPEIRSGGTLHLLTDLSPKPVSMGSTDPTALQVLFTLAPACRLYHLPRLHAKVYAADRSVALVTSGNLTHGGLVANFEYGIGIRREAAVEQVRRDVERFSELGLPIAAGELGSYAQVANKLRAATAALLDAASEPIRLAYEEALAEAHHHLIGLRLAKGPIHNVFAKTIGYLLETHGPMTTRDLYLRVQAIHPDLCDDAVDRIIQGRNFGAKWKHALRTAQQHMKQARRIELHHGFWICAPKSHHS